MNDTKRKSNRGAGSKELSPCRLGKIQKILDLMAFQARMPLNPFVDKNAAYEAAGCGPRASMYIFAH